MIFVRASQHGQIGVDVRSVDRPVIRAALAVAAGMLGFLDLAEALGGPAGEIEGQAGIRWQHWLDNVGGGPMQW